MKIQRFAVLVGFGLFACKAGGSASSEATARASSSARQQPVPSSSTSSGASAVIPPTRKLYSIPVGPSLAIQAGKGLGPIRFGATLQTIERLMDATCSEKSEVLCRYVAHAVDYHLTDGTLSKIVVHGDERRFDANPEHTYGIFNGRFPEKVRLGMYREFVVEGLGEPLSSEDVEPTAILTTVKRDRYKHMVLEYDKLKNGNVVLAGVVLSKPEAGEGVAPPK